MVSTSRKLKLIDEKRRGLQPKSKKAVKKKFEELLYQEFPIAPKEKHAVVTELPATPLTENDISEPAIASSRQISESSQPVSVNHNFQNRILIFKILNTQLFFKNKTVKVITEVLTQLP